MANLRWVTPVRAFDLDFEVGKIDSVFGREYRIQETPARTEVTPSLLCRYTCGRPIGVRSRAVFGRDAVNVAVSVTNGSTYKETFAFYNEVDTNLAKTATGRLGLVLPTPGRLEIGASGQYGAQDLQGNNEVAQWQHGVDVHLAVRNFEATAEFLEGRATGRSSPGSPARCDVAPCLRVVAAYASLGYRARNWVMPFARVDWRDAEHHSGADFVYFSQLVRLTPGVRFDLGTNVAIKAQYTVNLEVDRVPQIPNDTFTSSVVAHF